MSGPIVRSGPSKEYSSNWDSVFGDKKKKPAKKKTGAAAKKKNRKKKS